MISAKLLHTLIDKEAFLKTDGMKFAVKIADVREVFGRIDVLVQPATGSIVRQWVSLERMEPVEGGKFLAEVRP